MQYENGSMEKIADRRDSGDAMHEFLCAFKRELTNIFGSDCNTEYERGWLAISGTVRWYMAMREASRKTIPEIGKLMALLNWHDGESMDVWIVDCAIRHGVIKPM